MAKSETKNWMFDQVKETCEKGLSQDELINQLTIQKIEYGRDCIAQFLSMTIGKSEEEMENYHYKLDFELQKRIMELGGKTRDRIFIQKSK